MWASIEFLSAIEFLSLKPARSEEALRLSRQSQWVHQLSIASWFTAWQFSWQGVLLSVALTFGYGLCLVRGQSRLAEHRVPAWRIIGYLTVGVGSFVYVTCGPVGVFSHEYLWIFALQVAVVAAVTPVGLATGRPIDVMCAAWESQRPRQLLSGRLGRFAMFPLVSSVLAAVSVLSVFYSGYGQAALNSSWVMAVLMVHMLIVGLLVVLPLLTDDLLPAWATPGVRAVIACVDGLIDALPGILVMTASSQLMPHFPGFDASLSHLRTMSASLDQRFAGGALLAVAEVIGLPMVGLVFADWVRSDRAETQRIDAELDEHSDETMTPWWIDKA